MYRDYMVFIIDFFDNIEFHFVFLQKSGYVIYILKSIECRIENI